MEALAGLLGLYLFAVLIILPIWTLIKINGQRGDHDALQRRLANLEAAVKTLREKLNLATLATPPSSESVKSKVPADPVQSMAKDDTAAPFRILPLPRSADSNPPQSQHGATVNPATPTPMLASVPSPSPAPSEGPSLLPPVIPPPLATIAPAATVKPTPASRPTAIPIPPAKAKPAFNLELFMGAKLFAWIGGLALLLCVAFFLKDYHDVIPEAVRVAIGFLFGIGLIVGGLKISHVKSAVTSHTLIGAGVVSLYAVTIACGKDHFNFLPPGGILLLMSLITATAFLLAIRLNAQAVAILGILGGFLTPKILSTGVDNPVGFFTYLALLNVGLIAVALHRRWFYLVPLGAAGTVLMMIGWANKFYAPEKTLTIMTVCLGYCALFLGASETGRRLGRHHRFLTLCAATLPIVAFGFALFFLDYPGVASNAGMYIGFIFLADVALLTLAWRDEDSPRLHLLAGLSAFALLSIWTGRHLTDDLLRWALGAYLVFALLHTVFPVLLQRHRPASAPTWWSQLFPPLTLLLLLLPIYRLDAVPFMVWPAILLIDLLAIGLAVVSASLTAVATVLVLTLIATGLCIFKESTVAVVFAPSLLLIIGGFAVFFFAASLWLVRKLGDKLPAGDPQLTGVFGDARAQIPAFASLLPFLLLIMVCLRLTVPDPSAIFGLGLLLVVLTLGLARILLIEWLPACALVGMAALQYAWHSCHFDPSAASLPLVWYISFYAIFALYPFLFRREFVRLTGPWAVSALSGLAHFWMIYQSIRTGWPGTEKILGLVPALFVLAPLGSLFIVLRTIPADNPKRLNQLAWFGGVALFFITLIFPIQFDHERQLLTVAWALEGAALLWLFHRVPHAGLRAVGTVLLVIAFVRLAANPAVLSYHMRGEIAIFNWYLYAYGLATVALFWSAKLLAPPRERVLGFNAPPLFNALGVILAFILLNIEIADYFTPPGSPSLAFRFSGNHTRDMIYTIAWALFALGLLVIGIWKQTRTARLTAIALLSVALFKLFLHDLAHLPALYRVGALFGVAVIAMLASFAYQRFLPSNEKTPPPQS